MQVDFKRARQATANCCSHIKKTYQRVFDRAIGEGKVAPTRLQWLMAYGVIGWQKLKRAIKWLVADSSAHNSAHPDAGQPGAHRHGVRPAWLTVKILAVIFVGLLGWGVFAQIEQSARAPGQVIASSRTQYLQAGNDGVIEVILVKEGDRVNKGDLLARLDQTQAKAAVEDSQAKVAALNATLVRLRAEVLGHSLKFPDEVHQFPAFIANETELYQRRQKALHDETRSLEDMLAVANRELGLTQPLLQKGDVSEAEVLRLKRQVYELQGNLSNRRNKYFQDAQAEMTKAQEDLETQQQVLADRRAVYERTEIRASTDGIVRNIRLTTVGAKVRAGDVVMELLPTDSGLVVEAKLKPSDLAFIHKGSPASIKLDAYDYSIYGVLHGEVTYISPDALNEDSRNGEKVFYRVQVHVDEKQVLHTAGGKKIEIQPGMTAQVEIRTGSMRALTYFMKPVTKNLSGAFSER